MFNITPGVFINNKALPAKPQYHGGSITPVVPPIAPGAEIAVYGEQEPQEFRIPREDVVKGVLDGSIPLRIWGLSSITLDTRCLGRLKSVIVLPMFQ